MPLWMKENNYGGHDMLPGIYYGLTCFPPMWAALSYIEVETEISMCMNGLHRRLEQHAVVSHRMATRRLGGCNTYFVRKRALTNALLLLKLPALHVAAKIEKTLSDFIPSQILTLQRPSAVLDSDIYIESASRGYLRKSLF
jgi:hypothetical protein